MLQPTLTYSTQLIHKQYSLSLRVSHGVLNGGVRGATRKIKQKFTGQKQEIMGKMMLVFSTKTPNPKISFSRIFTYLSTVII